MTLDRLIKATVNRAVKSDTTEWGGRGDTMCVASPDGWFRAGDWDVEHRRWGVYTEQGYVAGFIHITGR